MVCIEIRKEVSILPIRKHRAPIQGTHEPVSFPNREPRRASPPEPCDSEIPVRGLAVRLAT